MVAGTNDGQSGLIAAGSGLEMLAAGGINSNASSSAAGATNAPAVQEVFAAPALWPMCDPSITLKVLHKLPVEECHLKKPLPKSYETWEKLSAKQQSKVIAFFAGLTPEVKAKVQAAATASAQVAAVGETSRAENTSKDDRARLGNSCALE